MDPFLGALADADGTSGTDTFSRWVGAASDADLVVVEELIRAERYRRALSNEDVDAVCDDAFNRLFDSKGLPTVPEVTSGGLLLCPGAVVARSQMSHRCAFVLVDDDWAFNHPEIVTDDVRSLGDRGGSMRSVTVLVARDGMRVDMVRCRARNGGHTREKVHSFSVVNGKLVEERARQVVSTPGRGH